MLPAGSYSLEQLEHLANVCHRSGLFEDITDAAQAFMKILRGQEMGLPVTTSMQAFDIIRKRLFIKPWAIAAKINACGYGAYRVVEQTPERCTICFRRKFPHVGWEDCPPVTYTFEEAKAHGLVDRSPHWKTSTAHMLYQRAMGRGGAMYFPELLAGLQPPPDDTPIAPEQHAQNVYDVYGVDPEPGATPTPAAEPEASTACDGGRRGGHSLVEATSTLHRVHGGKDEAWLVGYWAKVCKQAGVLDCSQLPLSTLTDLHKRVRDHYLQGATEAPAQDAGQEA
jgi:hypothetical protein